MVLGAIGGASSLLDKTTGFNPIGSAIGGISSLLGGGNGRSEKRSKRQKFRSAIHNAGVNSSFAQNTHSDNWAHLKRVAQFINSKGELAIKYINDRYGNQRRFGPKKGGPSADEIIGNFSMWKKANTQTVQALTNKGGSPSGSVSQASGQNQNTNNGMIKKVIAGTGLAFVLNKLFG